MGLNVSCPALGFFLLGTGEKRAEKEGRPPTPRFHSKLQPGSVGQAPSSPCPVVPQQGLAPGWLHEHDQTGTGKEKGW